MKNMKQSTVKHAILGAFLALLALAPAAVSPQGTQTGLPFDLGDGHQNTGALINVL